MMATDERGPQAETDRHITANEMGSVNMLAFHTPTPQRFTDRVRTQLEDSRDQLRRMDREMQSALAEVDAAQSEAAATLPTVALPELTAPRPRGTCRPFAGGRTQRYRYVAGAWRKSSPAWELLWQRRHNVRACREDLCLLLDNTDRVLGGAAGLTAIIDQLAQEGLRPGQELMYEEELKSLSHKLNDVFHQINLAAFHLHGTLAKEKEVAVNIAAGTEQGDDIVRHHQAAVWAYRQYLQYRATGNQYVTSAVQAIELFMEALRKEVMNRQVNDVHAQIQRVQKERAEKMAAWQRRQEERRLAGEDMEDDALDSDLPDLPPVATVSHEDARPITPPVITPPIPTAAATKPADTKPADTESATADADDEWSEDEMETRPIFPLIILAMILLGVGYYYFFMKG